MPWCPHCRVDDASSRATCQRCGRRYEAPLALGERLPLAAARPPPAPRATRLGHGLDPLEQRPRGHRGTLLGYVAPEDAPSPSRPPGPSPSAAPAPSPASVSAEGLPALSRARRRRGEVPAAPRIASPTLPSPSGGRTTWRWLLVPLLLSLGLALGVGYRWSRPGPVSATVLDGQEGGQLLELRCPSCPPGSQLALEGAPVSVVEGRALSRLRAPLEPGRHRLQLQLAKGHGALEPLSLTVDVSHRWSVDLAELDSAEPALRIRLSAHPDGRALLDGAALELGASGVAERRVSLRAALEGPAETTQRLSLRYPWELRFPGGAPLTGELTTALNVTPLVIEAPGTHVVTDATTFMLAGRTLPGAHVTAGGHPLTVDTTGRFAQRMNISSVGDVTLSVRAKAAQQAPRTVDVLVSRVERLSEAAARWREGALRDYSELTRDPEPTAGARVALDGTLREVTLLGHHSSLLLEVTRGCPGAPCRVRLYYGAPSPAPAGRAVSAYGRLRARRDWQEPRVPSVDALFLLEKR